jgi:RNA recognition motif-containing protein
MTSSVKSSSTEFSFRKEGQHRAQSKQRVKKEELMQNVVQVREISPKATDKTVADFFSFCGKINKLTMKVYPSSHVSRDPASSDGAQMAIVEFDTDAAARTALLLSNALIVDRPITVSVHNGDFNASGATIRTAADRGGDLDAKPQHLPDEQRSKTSVVASLVAAGYV